MYPSLVIAYSFSFFFFNDTATTEIYTLSLHDALPISSSTTFCDLRSISGARSRRERCSTSGLCSKSVASAMWGVEATRSEEHTSELQSRLHLVCRLLLEKKKKKNI